MKKFLLSLFFIPLFMPLIHGMEQVQQVAPTIYSNRNNVPSLLTLADKKLVEIIKKQDKQYLASCMEKQLPFAANLESNYCLFEPVITGFHDFLITENATNCSNNTKVESFDVGKFKENPFIIRLLLARLWNKYPYLSFQSTQELTFRNNLCFSVDEENRTVKIWDPLKKDFLEPDTNGAKDDRGDIKAKLRTPDIEHTLTELNVSGADSSAGYTVTISGTLPNGKAMQIIPFKRFQYRIKTRGNPCLLTIKNNNGIQEQCNITNVDPFFGLYLCSNALIVKGNSVIMYKDKGTSIFYKDLDTISRVFHVFDNGLLILDKENQLKIFDICAEKFLTLDPTFDRTNFLNIIAVPRNGRVALLNKVKDNNTEQEICIYDIKTRTKILNIRCNYDQNAVLTFSFDGSLLCIFDDKRITVWDIDTHEEIYTRQENESIRILHVRFTPDNYIQFQTYNAKNELFFGILNLFTKCCIYSSLDKFDQKPAEDYIITTCLGKRSITYSNYYENIGTELIQQSLYDPTLIPLLEQCSGIQISLLAVAAKFKQELLKLCTESKLFKDYYQKMPEALQKLVPIIPDYRCATHQEKQ